MRIRAQCRECGLPFRSTISAEGEPLLCPNCDHRWEIAGEGWSDAERRVDICPLCGCKHLYRQRDFNRSLGCLLVIIGAIFVPWTYGLSLVALSLVDLWLWFRLPESVVCYRCDTVYRDAIPLPRQTEVDLLKHDVVKYGKSWQDVDMDADA